MDMSILTKAKIKSITNNRYVLGAFFCPLSKRVRSVAGGLSVNVSPSSASSPLSSDTSSTCRGADVSDGDSDNERWWASEAAWRLRRAAVRGDGGASGPLDDCRRSRFTMIWLK